MVVPTVHAHHLELIIPTQGGIALLVCRIHSSASVPQKPNKGFLDKSRVTVMRAVLGGFPPILRGDYIPWAANLRAASSGSRERWSSLFDNASLHTMALAWESPSKPLSIGRPRQP